MSTLTAGKVLADVVRYEIPRFSREAKLVDASQALVIGEVCTSGAGGRMKALGTHANEVQAIAITGSVSAGSFTLGIPQPDGGVVWTNPIAYNANTAGIQTGVDTTPFGASIVVGGTAITAMTFTFSGVAYQGEGWDLIQFNSQGLTAEEDVSITRTTAGGRVVAATDEVQTATITGTGSAGTFTLTVPLPNGGTMTTAGIAYNANASVIEAALDTAFALQTPVIPDESITVAGTDMDTGDITFTFDGEVWEGRNWPLVTFATLATGWTAASFAETTEGGPAAGGLAEAICLAAVTTAGGVLTTKGLFLVRHAVVDVNQLDFGNGIKDDCIAQLKAVGIVAREEPDIVETI